MVNMIKMVLKSDRRIVLLLFIIVFAVGVIFSPSIGPAWDEPDNMFAGGVYWNFFAKGGNPAVFDTFANGSSYFGDYIYPYDRTISHLPPVYNYVGSFLAVTLERLGMPVQGSTVIIGYHIAAVLFFALLVSTVYLFGLLFGLSRWASLFGAAATFLYPTLFGHGMSDTKDIAQASLFVLSLYFLTKGTLQGITRDLIWGGIALGLGFASKFNAVYVPIIWGGWVLLRTVNLKLKNEKSSYFTFYILHFTFVLLVALVTVFLVWPYLWFEPIKHMIEVVDYFTHSGVGFPFLWAGKLYQSSRGIAYWWYPLGSLVIGTPIPLLGLMVIGTLDVLWFYKRHPERLLLLIWIGVPFLRGLLPWTALYDGLRHFVEVLPACMLLAAIGIATLWRLKLKLATMIIASATLVHLLFIALTYFPYSSGYYNAFASNPNQNFDRDIEALSVKEGIDYLHKRYGAIHAWVPIGAHLSWYYLTTPGDKYVYSAGEADSIVLVNKSTHIREDEFTPSVAPDFVIDRVIRRGNAIFGWVYRRR